MLKALRKFIWSKPHYLFLIVALLFALYALTDLNSSIDIHLHDTYFIVHTAVLYWALGLVLIILWGLNQLIFRWMWKKQVLNWHVGITMIIVILLLTLGWYHDIVVPPGKNPRSYLDYYQEQFRKELPVAIPLVLLSTLSLLLLLLNVFVGIYKTLRQGENRSRS